MKKISLIFLVYFVSIISSTIYASNILGNTSNTPIKVNTSVQIPEQGKLQYIQLVFCDDNMKLSKQNFMNIRPGQTKEICSIFVNTSQKDKIDVNASFVDARQDAEGKFICSLGSETGAQSVLSHIAYSTGAYSFTLNPQQKIIKKAKISIPKDMTGTLRGCLGYQLNIEKPDNYTGLFFVVRRKVGIIEVNITGDVYDFGWRDDIKYTYKDNQIAILDSVALFLGILLIYLIMISVKSKKKK